MLDVIPQLLASRSARRARSVGDSVQLELQAREHIDIGTRCLTVRTSTPTAGTSSSAAPASTPPASPAISSATSAPASSAAASTAPAAPARVVVELTRSHRTGAGDVGTIDTDQLSVVGPTERRSHCGCTASSRHGRAYRLHEQRGVGTARAQGPACGSGDFQADFTTSRSDSVVVSGTWTISTFFPGGAHPTTQLTAVIVDTTSGAVIAPSQLFVGSSLKTLAAATATATTAKLNAIGCSDEVRVMASHQLPTTTWAPPSGDQGC